MKRKSEWVKKPSGIPQNLMSKFPKYLLMLAQGKEAEITGSEGTLQNTLNELFPKLKNLQKKHIQEIWTDCNNISESWKKIVEKIFVGGNFRNNVF